MQKFLLTGILLLYLGCPMAPETTASGDFILLTANLLYTNDERAGIVSKALLAMDAEVMILIEAVPGSNIDVHLLQAAGYTCFLQTGSHAAFSILLAVKGPADFGTIPVDFSTTSEPSLLASFATCRITRQARSMCIMGVHIPAPFYYNELFRDLAFSQLQSLVEEGCLSTAAGSGVAGDLVMIGGDFNCFPSDPRLRTLTRQGLEDSQLANYDLYATTWTPGWLPEVARIDYIFAASQLPAVRQQTFTIPGSDHSGVVAEFKL